MSKRNRKQPGRKPSDRRRMIPMYIGQGGTLQEATDSLCDAIKATPYKPRDKVAVLAARVGSVHGVPNGYRMELTNCVMCGHPLWLSSDNADEIRSKGMVIKAICAKDCDWRPPT